MGQRVFVDANILVSKTCMDWLFLLHQTSGSMFNLASTEDVISEVVKARRRNHPQAPGHSTFRRANLIRKCLDEILIDFPSSLPFTGSDNDDYHVHAAACAYNADLLLTNDSPSHFTSSPQKETYEVITADNFFILIADSAPELLPPVIKKQQSYWGKQSKNPLPLPDALRKSDCPDFAERVQYEIEKQDS